jgi:putative PIN family toxin of toxin-antitoxin system
VRRITADSNIYISALNFGGKPLEVVELARAGEIELAISNAIITEVSRILYVKFSWKSEDINDVIDQILGFCTHVQADYTLDVVSADPDDNRVLECALKADSDTVVTGDTDLLTLGEFRALAFRTRLTSWRRSKPDLVRILACLAVARVRAKRPSVETIGDRDLRRQRSVNRTALRDLEKPASLPVAQIAGEMNGSFDQIDQRVGLLTGGAVLRIHAVVPQGDVDPFERPPLPLRI